MIAEVVSIGTELLLGQIVDTDAAYLAQQLSALGINVYHRATVGDNLGRAITTLRQATERADLVITIGGLGPTMDDLTRDAIAAVMDAPLERDSAIVQHLIEWFTRRSYTMNDTILRQADVPTGAIALPNANGTAPGLLLEKDGMGESTVEEKTLDLMNASNPSVAPYAKTGEVHLRVTARAANEVEADAQITPVIADIKQRLGDVVYGEDETTLEKAVVALLTEKKQTVATAESCTGGTLSGRITSVPGSSVVFNVGLTTYSNNAKIHLLKIPSSIVGSFGAVSSEVAQAMAERVRELADADYGVSVTGIAGPGGGTDEKPVGLVYIGLATKSSVASAKHHFTGLREDIRLRSTQAALDLLRKELLKP